MKRYLVIFFTIFLASGAYAHQIKFMGGAGLSKYSVWPEEFYSNDMGDEASYEIDYIKKFLVGCGLDFDLTKNISFEIDCLYFQKGAKVQEVYRNLEIYMVPEIYALNVASFPALFRIKFLPGLFPYVSAGGELSIILSHKRFYEGRMDEEDSKVTTKSFDYGLVFGAGFDIGLHPLSFFMEGRFHLGLRNIIKGEENFTSLKTRSIVLMLGFKI